VGFEVGAAGFPFLDRTGAKGSAAEAVRGRHETRGLGSLKTSAPVSVHEGIDHPAYMIGRNKIIQQR